MMYFPSSRAMGQRARERHENKGRHELITFTNVEPEDTQAFEDQYEEKLQMDEYEKQEVLFGGFSVWMYVDGVLAGEAYGKLVKDMDEEIEDREALSDAFYIYSFTILPAFQKAGLGKILFAYMLGRLQGMKVVMHATSPGMVRLGELFGFSKGAVHDGWYNTPRQAVFMSL